VCEVAGLHPETFARQHKATYGLTPAAYRVCLRLNHAARLCWSRLDLSVAEIARESGFENRAYFHRAFLKSFGVTPAAVRARQLCALEAA
jgi:AraC-like DNA-binding protein